ncbi:heavy-metal-associated domain-containing protein [Mesorhizobium sp. A623]
MPTLNVSDMTYRHCAGTVKKAIHGIGSQAAVMVDLASKTVSIIVLRRPRFR